MESAFKDLHWGKEIGIRDYLQPVTIPEALDILSEFDGRALIVSGGTDVIPLLRRGDLEADALVDITRLPDMNSIKAEGDWIFLGALVTHGQVCSSPLIRGRAGLLAEAAAAIGSPQIRNVATVAGNLVSGQPAADAALPLLALDARVTVVSKTGSREVPLKEFFVRPGETRVDPRREVLTSDPLPRAGEESGGMFSSAEPAKIPFSSHIGRRRRQSRLNRKRKRSGRRRSPSDPWRRFLSGPGRPRLGFAAPPLRRETLERAGAGCL